jgi:hypothetical protein
MSVNQSFQINVERVQLARIRFDSMLNDDPTPLEKEGHHFAVLRFHVFLIFHHSSLHTSVSSAHSQHISESIRSTEATGSSALVMGRPTTMRSAPIDRASAGVATRRWSSSEAHAGLTPGVIIWNSSPHSDLTS